MKTCQLCRKQFAVLQEDQDFYRKMDVPEPTLCHQCREKRRLVWRNEWKLYKRKCDLTGQEIISYISPDKPQKVYSLDAWFSDKWDAREYGRDFDFKRPFFEQFKELLRQTPHIPLLIGECENSIYTNYSWGNKNCYMVSAADFNCDCFYSGYLFRSRDCMDCFFVNDSELCYECVDCEKCYGVSFSQKCKNCCDCAYCHECMRCNNCIGCINLRDKNYFVFNKQLSKEEFEKVKLRLKENPDEIKQNLIKLRMQQPVKSIHMNNCDNCIGNDLMNCKNCFLCFDLIDSEDCRYVTYGIKSKDCMDMNGAPHCQLVYESVACPQCYNCRFCTACWVKSSCLTYCHLCRASANCFGCVSLHKNSYCILNKQYSKEEYKELVPRIIEHMVKNKEWGEFFPVDVSPFDSPANKL